MIKTRITHSFIEIEAIKVENTTFKSNQEEVKEKLVLFANVTYDYAGFLENKDKSDKIKIMLNEIMELLWNTLNFY